MKFNDDKSKIFLKEKYCIIETPVEHAEHSVEVVSKMINMGWTLMSGATFDDGKIIHSLVKEPKNG